MKMFFKYLRGYRRIFIMLAVFFVIFTGSFIMYRLPVKAVLYPSLLCVGVGFVWLTADFIRVKRKHEKLQKIKSFSDIPSERLRSYDSITEDDCVKIIRLLLDEHNAYRLETERKYADMTEYYTVWAHQIKTPISSMRLNLQNEDSALSRKLSSDLRRIEQYAEMVMTFLRLDSDSTDYVFREYDIDRLTRAAVKKFSSEFIGRGLGLIYDVPPHTTVVTDEKWLSFVIEQVLSNALKYTPSGSITISLVGEKTLRIEDTGIGIAPEDLPRIFENGYTGCNGRGDRKASGIGLYLCKRICTNLGHTIKASSVPDVGTAVDIDLAQVKYEIE